MANKRKKNDPNPMFVTNLNELLMHFNNKTSQRNAKFKYLKRYLSLNILVSMGLIKYDLI